jgi:hypothetical protein
VEPTTKVQPPMVLRTVKIGALYSRYIKIYVLYIVALHESLGGNEHKSPLNEPNNLQAV